MFKKFLTVSAICLLAAIYAPVNAFPKGDITQDNDSFGTKLPDGLKAKDIVGFIAPKEDANNAALVGAKLWPPIRNSFVAIACFPKAAPGQEQSCDNFDGKTRVYLGVISYDGPGSQPKLIAKSKAALNVRTEFDHSNFDPPESSNNSSDEGVFPQTYIGFDLAPYKISETETAFGLRMGWEHSFSGGGITTNALALFKIDGNELINIFSEPVYYSENIAGEWNKDGTRKHDESKSENILLITPKKKNGYFDVVMKEKSKSKNKWQQKFTWDQANKRYLPVN